MVRIGIAVVEHGEDILVGVRGPDGPLPGFAEFPGGKCDPGESAADCAARECLEETGLAVEPGVRLLETEFTYPHGAVHLAFFHCRLAAESRHQAPANAFRWHPRRELGSLNFPEGNREVVRRLLDPVWPQLSGGETGVIPAAAKES